MKELQRKVSRLEAHVNLKVVSQEDRIQVVLGSAEQRKSEVKRRKAKLVEKYGPQGLEKIVFIEIIDRYPDNEVGSI